MTDWRLIYNEFLSDLNHSRDFAVRNLDENIQFDEKLTYLIEAYGSAFLLGDEENKIRIQYEDCCVKCITDLLEEYCGNNNR